MKDTVLVGAVFDCNVYLQAAVREKSVAAECLRLVEKGLIRLYLIEEITAEVEEVLNRPEIRNHFQTLTDEIIEAFILRLRNNSQIIRQIQRENAQKSTFIYRTTQKRTRNSRNRSGSEPVFGDCRNPPAGDRSAGESLAFQTG